MLHSTFSEEAYLISCYQIPFREFSKHTTTLYYRYDMKMYCTFVLFVNQHFPGLPASGTHCIKMNLGEVGWSDVDWICLTKDRNRWRALLNAVINLAVT
jgi:hypothetical protein